MSLSCRLRLHGCRVQIALRRVSEAAVCSSLFSTTALCWALCFWQLYYQPAPERGHAESKRVALVRQKMIRKGRSETLFSPLLFRSPFAVTLVSHCLSAVQSCCRWNAFVFHTRSIIAERQNRSPVVQIMFKFPCHIIYTVAVGFTFHSARCEPLHRALRCCVCSLPILWLSVAWTVL